MTSFPQTVKDTLFRIIDEMAADPRPFVRSPGTDFTRDRKLSFLDTINLILSMEGGTLNRELLSFFLYNPLETPTASAFVQQRSKLLPDAFQHLFSRFTQSFQVQMPPDGFRILAADGMDTVFFCDAFDKENHIDNSTLKGYNAMHVTSLYDLGAKIYSDAFIQNGSAKDEFQAFCAMVDRYPPYLAPYTIFLADRGFASYNVFSHVIEKGAFFLIRTKDVDSNGIASRLPIPSSGEFDKTISITLVRRQTNYFKNLPGAKFIHKECPFDFLEYGSDQTYTMTLRFVRLVLPDGSHECLVTNLSQDRFPSEKLFRLYGLRWGVETSFRELKYSVGLVNFHCRKPQFVIQEIWARLTLYNFCEIITTHTVKLMAKDQGTGKKKHTYQVNFTMAIHVCHCFLRALPHGDPPNVEDLIRRYMLPVREGRAFMCRTRFCRAVSFLYRVR